MCLLFLFVCFLTFFILDYEQFLLCLFSPSSFSQSFLTFFLIICLVADFVSACDLFKEVQKRDPYSLEHMDTYSNILYVKVGYETLIKTLQNFESPAFC